MLAVVVVVFRGRHSFGNGSGTGHTGIIIQVAVHHEVLVVVVVIVVAIIIISEISSNSGSNLIRTTTLTIIIFPTIPIKSTRTDDDG